MKRGEGALNLGPERDGQGALRRYLDIVKAANVGIVLFILVLWITIYFTHDASCRLIPGLALFLVALNLLRMAFVILLAGGFRSAKPFADCVASIVRNWWRVRVWRHLFRITLALVLVAYVGSYLILSRRGIAEAREMQGVAFWYVSPLKPGLNLKQWRRWHFFFYWFYEPLNDMEHMIGTCKYGPDRCGGFSLARPDDWEEDKK